MMDWTTKAWGVDFSYAASKFNFKNMVAAGMTFAIGEIGYGTTPNTNWPNAVQAMYDGGVPVRGGYFAPWPNYYATTLQSIAEVEALDTYLPLAKDQMWEVYAEGIANKNIQVVAIDMEETPQMTSLANNVWISETFHWFMERVLKYTPTINPLIKQIVPYTRQSFISGVSPDMAAWMQFMNPAWSAYYTKTGGVVIKDWTTLAQYLPLATQQFNGHDNPPFCFTPGWSMLQFWGDGIETPDILNAQGTYTFLDCNLFNGTPAEMIAWAGGTTTPVTPPTPPVVVVPPATDLATIQAAVVDLQTRMAAQEAWRKSIDTWIAQEPQ